MTDQFVAEIRIFPFTFAPTGWAECNGQLLPISQNTALFSLLGTTYGGDGKTTFGLPDMQGNVPVHPGQGQGLSQRFLGEMSGVDSVTLLESETQIHAHALNVSPDPADIATPQPGESLARAVGGQSYQTVTNANLVAMSPQVLGPAGGDLPHNNLMPYLTLTFCIALQGIFPQRP
jgi:microcystin-dependent protein